jgi:hypothetical protein
MTVIHTRGSSSVVIGLVITRSGSIVEERMRSNPDDVSSDAELTE